MVVFRGSGGKPRAAGGAAAVLLAVWLAPAWADRASTPAEGAAGAEPAAADTAAPSTLLLALDGVPFRVIEQARERGAFAGWSRPAPLVSTFPSTTHVAFTELLGPFGVEPAEGYELRYYSRDENQIVGGSPFTYQKQTYGWKQRVDIRRKTFFGKFLLYLSPRTTARREIKHLRRAMLVERASPILAHIGSTDALQHLRGDEATVRFLLRLDEELTRLRQAYRERLGKPLRIVMYSDHGNGDRKIRSVRGIKRLLRQEGLRPVRKLRRPGDVVVPSFGIVSYGSLFLDSARAHDAAAAAVRHRGIELAVWRSGPRRAEVLSHDGHAAIVWREAKNGHVELAYQALEGDPLGLRQALARLAGSGELDADGFADRESWLYETADNEFPDAPGRIVDAVAGGQVRSPATVLLSLGAGYGWGWRAAHAMSRIQGGRIEGTHGALDRDSSLGFWMIDDASVEVPVVQRAGRALAAFAGPPAQLANGSETRGSEF